MNIEVKREDLIKILYALKEKYKSCFSRDKLTFCDVREKSLHNGICFYIGWQFPVFLGVFEDVFAEMIEKKLIVLTNRYISPSIYHCVNSKYENVLPYLDICFLPRIEAISKIINYLENEKSRSKVLS